MLTAHVASTGGSVLHAVDANKRRIFVHQDECEFEVGDCLPGDRIEIAEVVSTPKGAKGFTARWIGRPEREPERELEAEVTHVDRRKMFGFVRPDGAPDRARSGRNPDDVLFHISGAVDYRGLAGSEIFDRVVVGCRLRGVVRETFRGSRLVDYEPA